ncbi:TetR/AcrR family transcriptional regulator [Actinacidiphila glaucinigra]|uniref:TetR/AcrR family transcriptional regulator n=1 Tax=Actinacidiphila glaucinigra TaxID=235986 RepID=UPI00366CBCBB
MPSITRRRSAKLGRPTSAEADVLAATQRLLAGGATFTELGVQQICTEAGVARSTFYSHFRDKTDLLLRLAGRLMATSFDVTSAWQPAAGVEGLEEAFLQVIQVYRRHAAVRRALAEVATYDSAVRDYFTAELNQFTDWTIKILRAEQEAGRTPAGLDPVSATRIIVTGGERALTDQVTSADPASDPAFARELAHTWWHGVYRRPGT